MENMAKQAAERLAKELCAAKKTGDRYVKAVAQSVHDALAGFCDQQEEFAQAVAQSTKTLANVCAEATKGCGQAISDLEVYRRAVAAYFPGAVVDCVMTVRMSEHEDALANPSRDPIGERAKSRTSGNTDGVLSLDLMDLLGG